MSSTPKEKLLHTLDLLEVRFGKKLVTLLGAGLTAMPIISMILEGNTKGWPVLFLSVPTGLLTIAMAKNMPTRKSR